MSESKQDKRKLTDEDWDLLLPGKEVKLGNTRIEVKPLGFQEFVRTVRRLGEVREQLAGEGLTLENFNEPQNLLKLVGVVMDEIPELMSDVLCVEQADLELVPVTVMVDVARTVIEVNVKSQEGLLKNLTALARGMGEITASVSGT